MRDWHDANKAEDLPLTKPEDHYICVYGWNPARELLHTQYGYVNAFNWLILEADRMEAQGCKVSVLRGGTKVALYRAQKPGEVYPVHDHNMDDWRAYNRVQAVKLRERGRAF